MTALPPVQREAIELAFFAGLKQTEVAARTSALLGTVKSRIRMGLRAMRRSYELPEHAPSAAAVRLPRRLSRRHLSPR